MKLSVVATLYQSAPSIAEVRQRASTSARQLVVDDHKIVLLNGGSPANSLA
jgi:putative glycosyltransferase